MGITCNGACSHRVDDRDTEVRLPLEPQAGVTVEDADGDWWKGGADGWSSAATGKGGVPRSWELLVRSHGPMAPLRAIPTLDAREGDGPKTVGLVADGAEIPDGVHIVDVPSGSLADVQLWDIRPGDLFHVTFHVPDEDEVEIIDIPKDWRVFTEGTYEIPFSAATSITRPPLPKAPGSRGDAKVRGKLRTTVVRAGNPVGHQQWMSAMPVQGESWHADCDITEYVPEGER